MVYRETFCLQIHMHLHQLLILTNWINGVRQLRSRFIRRQRRKSERPEQNRDPRCQAGPSAKDSVIFSGGDSSKNYGADQQRLQISDLHYDKFPTPATFDCWKIRFQTEVCTCSQFLTEAMQWIKEVSWLIQWMNWDLRHLLVVFQCQILKYLMRELLQPWTKSSTIPISKGKSVWRNKRPRKRTVFLRGRQIAYLIYDQFRVTGTHDSVENYTDLFTIALRNDDIQEFDSKWDGILLSMTKIPPDDILEGLYKLRIRESEKLKTVLELIDLETHQKKLGPDYHRLKTMVKSSIEQEIRNKNFGSRNGNFEKKRRGQESGNKTACTKNSWSLLVMGNQRAVCARRQLQFPPRFE